MTLAKQSFPISLAGTLDTKTDSKIIQPGNFLVLENAVFTRPGSLVKRNGLDLLSQTVDYSDAQINQGQATSVFQDQLLLFTGEKAYSRLSHNTKWTDKGAASSIINDNYQIISNGYSQSNPDSNKIDNVECYAWSDSRGGVRYSILDSTTGNFIVADQILYATGTKPKVMFLEANAALGTASQFVIVFAVDNNLYIARIFSNTLSLAPVITPIANDVYYSLPSSGPAFEQIYDVCHCLSKQYIADNLTATTNHLLIAYGAFGTNGPLSTPSIIQINPNNSALLHSASAGVAEAPVKQVSITPFPDMSTNVTAQNGATGIVLWTQGNDLKIGKILTSFPMFVIEDLVTPEFFDLSKLVNLAMIWDSLTYNAQIGFKLFFEFSAEDNATLQYCVSGDLQVLITESEMIAAAIDNLVVKKGIGLYSKPYIHNHKPYIMTIHESTYQSTYFVTSDVLEVISKVNQTLAGGLRKSQLAEVSLDQYIYGNSVTSLLVAGPTTNFFSVTTPVGNGKFSISTMKKGKLESENNTIFTLLGITKSALDMISPNHFISVTINENLYVVGGVLQNYDGNKFTEAGFHLYPENLEVSFSKFVISTLSLGTPTVAQSTALFTIPANRLRPGDYFTVSSANNAARYYFWFNIDGIGSDPSVSGMSPIRVNLQSYMTDVQVATLIQLSFASAPEFSVNRSTSILEITNIAPGVSSGVLPGSVGIGNVQPGTYSYIAIWKYIDNAGRIHRSTTSIPIQAIVPPGSSTSVSITVPLLSPTAKDNVILEVYRTQSLGDLYYRVTSIEKPVFNIQNQDINLTKITFIDTLSDAEMSANELLYTTGGVLDNDSPPPCSLITVFKNRLFIAGLDNPNLIQYTKIIDPSDKQFIAGFSDYLSVETDTRGGDITALASMDDNLIIFKETQIFYLSGDGPTNTGEGGFGDPQLISTDVGCNNPNSVVLTPTGLLFKSPKGIYQLSRDLSVTYIGAAVERYNDLTISSSILLNSKNQVRFLTEESNALVYDYYVQKWTTFTNYAGVDCDIYNGKFTMLRANGQSFQENDDSYQDQTSLNTYQHIPLTLETANISTAGMIGFQRIYRILFLGEYKGGHAAKASLAYDFDPAFTAEINFDATDVVGSNTFGAATPFGSDPVFGGYYRPYMFRAHIKQQKCTSIRIRFEDVQLENFNEGLTLSSIVLEVGIKSSTDKLNYNKSTGST